MDELRTTRLGRHAESGFHEACAQSLLSGGDVSPHAPPVESFTWVSNGVATRNAVVVEAKAQIEHLAGSQLRLLGKNASLRLAKGFASCVPLPHGEASLLHCVALLLGSGHAYTCVAWSLHSPLWK